MAQRNACNATQISHRNADFEMFTTELLINRIFRATLVHLLVPQCSSSMVWCGLFFGLFYGLFYGMLWYVYDLSYGLLWSVLWSVYGLGMIVYVCDGLL